MAKQLRKMPTKNQILEHWKDKKMFDPPTTVDHCWGCGCKRHTERCHLLSKFDGGEDSCENLVLLCSRCHLSQENDCCTIDGRQWFCSAILDSAPYMNMEFNRVHAEMMDVANLIDSRDVVRALELIQTELKKGTTLRAIPRKLAESR